ncbi:MAG: hypothetical protein SGILL_004550 [Bacillariaceae sp.]
MVREDKQILYLNIVVVDGSVAVKTSVKKRVDNTKLPPSLKESFGNGAAHVVSMRSSPDKIAERLGGQLCEKTTRKLAEMGVTIEMEECYREGTYVVLQMQVLRVDARTIQGASGSGQEKLEKGKGETTASGTMLEWCLTIIGTENQKKLEEDYLPDKAQAKLQAKILAIMKEKLEKKGIIANIEIVKEEKQARYFYEKLKEIRKGEGDSSPGGDSSKSR